ncbi:MAG: divalent cation transporter [Methylomicrobium sp.]|nr:divalent cation transporter [Methylomicrobium sp.]
MSTINLDFVLLLAFAAGLSIPVGALVSSNLVIGSFCRRKALDSFVSYFGGGALLAAVTLVLIPHGVATSSIFSASVSFGLGGLLFWQFSAWAMRTRNTVTFFTGMVMDFFPEAILLGVAVSNDLVTAYLLTGLIALQNMPEGFAAHHEMQESGVSRRRLWTLFWIAPLIGPIAAGFGFTFLSANDSIVGDIMLFCSGGILFLIFQDIAPGAHMKNKSFPAIGAVSGFLLGMAGTMWIH